jgi:hypothetical protein
VGRHKALPEPAIPLVNQPTEFLLAGQARELFRGLSAGERQALGDVSGAIARLEQDGDRLRRRLEQLTAAEGDLGGKEGSRSTLATALEQERAAAVGQLATTVNALEELRLDLLRVKAGVADKGGLTRSLEQLRQLSAGVDALLDLSSRGAKATRDP